MSRTSAKGTTRGEIAALDLGLGGGESLAQLGERIAAGERRQQQAVGLERAADLDQRAGQIVDELQRQRRHHEIERRVAERQRLLVGDDGQAGTIGDAGARQRSAAMMVPTLPLAASTRRSASVGVPRSSAQSNRRSTAASRSAQVLGHPLEQERRRPERRGARAARAQQAVIEHEAGAAKAIDP